MAQYLPNRLLMRTLFIITVLLYSCSSGPADTVDYTDPEVIRAMDEVVYGMYLDEDRYEIRKDTISVGSDTMMVLLTVLHNDEEVYEEMRYEVLCPDWRVDGKKWYKREDMVSK